MRFYSSICPCRKLQEPLSNLLSCVEKICFAPHQVCRDFCFVTWRNFCYATPYIVVGIVTFICVVCWCQLCAVTNTGDKQRYAGSACKNVSVPLGLQCLDCSAGINVLKVSATVVNALNGEMCDSSHISSDWPV